MGRRGWEGGDGKREGGERGKGKRKGGEKGEVPNKTFRLRHWLTSLSPEEERGKF